MPTGSAAQRALAHPFELTGDLLQRAVPRGGCDAGHQDDQAIGSRFPGSRVEQLRFDDLSATIETRCLPGRVS